jgi:hypothetical protein
MNYQRELLKIYWIEERNRAYAAIAAAKRRIFWGNVTMALCGLVFVGTVGHIIYRVL